jgi:hypothetical protein
MDLPITDLMDESACSAELVTGLRPGGLACPRCHRSERTRVHDRRVPVIDYRRGHGRRAFNAFTGTVLHGTRRRPSGLVLIARDHPRRTHRPSVAELECDRSESIELRNRPQVADS